MGSSTDRARSPTRQITPRDGVQDGGRRSPTRQITARDGVQDGGRHSPADDVMRPRATRDPGQGPGHAAKPLELELILCEWHQLTELQDVSQTSRFTAQVFLQFRCRNGQDLPGEKWTNRRGGNYKETKYTDFFPKDGPPIPPPEWYLGQFDVQNSMSTEWRRLESFVRKDLETSKDLILSIRFEGAFSERLELFAFPFDEQEVSITVAFNCRIDGPVPVKLSIGDSVQMSAAVRADGFRIDDQWDMMKLVPLTHSRPADTDASAGTGTDTAEAAADGMGHEGGSSRHWVPIEDSEADGSLDVGVEQVGATRKFPAMRMTAKLQRRPTYFLVNIALPMGAFVLLSFLQFTVPREKSDHRLTITLTLVLTAAAFRQSVASLLPKISYLTVLDWYVVSSWALIILGTFEGGLVALIEDPGIARRVDHLSFAMLVIIWLLLQAALGWSADIQGVAVRWLAGSASPYSNYKALRNEESDGIWLSA